jgi:hypothetical protein
MGFIVPTYSMAARAGWNASDTKCYLGCYTSTDILATTRRGTMGSYVPQIRVWPGSYEVAREMPGRP